MTDIIPVEIKLRTRSRVLEVRFSNGQCFELPFEYLRVHSPSAEVQGHGPGEGILVVGKQDVVVRAVEPIGQYAVRLVFDDGHDSGLFTWRYLHELGEQKHKKWNEYLARVAQSAHARYGTDL
jgi:DUF971 family protein